MRQIKFRAWDKEEKQMLSNERLGVQPWNVMSSLMSGVGRWNFMQFTGLLDKNGKEIYEGDIVQYQYLNTLEQEVRKAEVKLMSIGDVNRNIEAYYPFCYSISGSYKDRSREITECYLTPPSDCEIIGNIYENPELLETNN